MFFGPDGWRDTSVLARADLGAGRAGPVVVEEYDATCVVPPGGWPTSAGNIRSPGAAVVTAPRIDPITLEVIRHALCSIADEMALRDAQRLLVVVRDTMDYSTALCDAGEVVAQGLTLAVQLGSFPTSCGGSWPSTATTSRLATC